MAQPVCGQGKANEIDAGTPALIVHATRPQQGHFPARHALYSARPYQRRHIAIEWPTERVAYALYAHPVGHVIA